MIDDFLAVLVFRCGNMAQGCVQDGDCLPGMECVVSSAGEEALKE
jgi:hypothetical protein